MEEALGGYELDVFVEKPHENCVCPLCFNVFKDPLQCSNGHCFCISCITKVQASDKKECPMCKIDISTTVLGRNLYLKNVIDDLECTCISTNKSSELSEDHCLWTGKLSDRMSHYNTNCEFFEVVCGLGNCQEMVEKRSLLQHQTFMCEHRIVTCKHCQETHISLDLEAHYLLCESYPVTCPNECGRTAPRSAIRSHVEVECPLQMVDCPLAAERKCLKCTGCVQRRLLAGHILSFAREMMSRVDILQNSNVSLVREKVALKDTVAQLHQQITSPNQVTLTVNDSVSNKLIGKGGLSGEGSVGKVGDLSNHVEDNTHHQKELLDTVSSTLSGRKPSKFGHFTIYCLGGVDLSMGQGLFGVANPYVKLCLGTQVYTSKPHIGGGQNPVWNLQEFSFIVSNSKNQHEQDMLEIQVLDKQTTGNDKMIAGCMLLICDFMANFDGDLQLFDESQKPVGRISVSSRMDARNEHARILNTTITLSNANKSSGESYVVYRNKKSRKWLLGNVVRSESDTTSVVRNTADVELVLQNTDLKRIPGVIMSFKDCGFAFALAKLVQSEMHFHADTLEVVLVNKIKESINDIRQTLNVSVEEAFPGLKVFNDVLEELFGVWRSIATNGQQFAPPNTLCSPSASGGFHAANTILIHVFAKAFVDFMIVQAALTRCLKTMASSNSAYCDGGGAFVVNTFCELLFDEVIEK